MDSAAAFPISFDRASRIPMTLLGAGPRVSLVTVSASTIDIRMGWAFHGTIPGEAVASARPLKNGLGELDGPLGIGVLRGVNYWRGAVLVNGANTGLVDVRLNPPIWARLGPLRALVRQLIVSVENQSGLVAALNPSTSPPAPDEPSQW